jgi:hypothetical protein
MSERKVEGFKKFSDIRGNKSDLGNLKEVTPSDIPPVDSSDVRGGIPNLPNTDTKRPVRFSKEKIEPEVSDENVVNEGDVKFYGKLAKFPKRTKASKAINFLENVKISKKSIWYLLIEKQENELQMVKYNNREGFDLHRFVLELKGFYIKKWSKEDPRLSKLVESIGIKGAPDFSAITNIPNIEVEPGKKLITKITEDLIKLLSK